MKPSARITGKIRYTSRKPERAGEARGFETFAFYRHGDGSTTLQAHCEIDEPAPTVVRDVIYSLDAAGRPLDLLLRLVVGGCFMGSGLIRVEGSTLRCDSHGPGIGAMSQVVETGGAYDGLGCHPIVADAYLTRCIDLNVGPHKREIRVFMPSTDHRGATPPVLAESRLFLEYVRQETVSVPAGTFACRLSRFTDEAGGMVTADGAHPAYEVWVTSDADSLFVQGGVGGYMQTWYELVELQR